MKKYPFFRKSVAVGVIILFVAIVYAPVFNANIISNDFWEEKLLDKKQKSPGVVIKKYNVYRNRNCEVFGYHFRGEGFYSFIPFGTSIFLKNQGYPPHSLSYDFVDIIVGSHIYFESWGDLGYTGFTNFPYFHGIIIFTNFNGYVWLHADYFAQVRGFEGHATKMVAILI